MKEENKLESSNPLITLFLKHWHVFYYFWSENLTLMKEKEYFINGKFIFEAILFTQKVKKHINGLSVIFESSCIYLTACIWHLTIPVGW